MKYLLFTLFAACAKKDIIKYDCPSKDYNICTDKIIELCGGPGHIIMIDTLDDKTLGQCSQK